MADDKMTLIYFDVRGRAEAVRYMFAYKGVEFEDRRINFKEDWPALKASMPTESLPVLLHKGRQLSQSNTIARYVGRMIGLSGKDDWEQAFLNSIVDLRGEIVEEAAGILRLKTDEEKDAFREKLVKEVLPKKLAIQTNLMKTSASRPFILGDKPSWADFVVAATTDSLDTMTKGEVRGINAGLKEHQLRVEALPAVHAYIEKCPKSAF